MRKIVLFLACSLLYLALSIYAVEPDPNLIVSTKQGKVLGYYPNTSTRAFTGIRFAASTAGSNRFKPPVNVPDVVSPDTFDATNYGNVCVQSDTSGNKYDQDQSEDCLFLNIWTPANANATNKYPVFFWIHGGAFKYGTGNMYQGDYWTQISQQVGSPIVVVTFNYRLGILGFLSDSLMKTENGLTPGNLGLLDQLSALTWVRKNIDNFGGDSSKITIGGESAGGVSTLILLTSPLLGKVKGAIAQSGSFLPWLIQQTVSDANNISTKFKNAVNCTQLSCLRALPTSTILSYQDDSSDLFVPVIDSYVTNDTIYNNFLIGNYKQVPTIIGTTYNETTQWTCGSYPPDIGTAAQRSAMVGVFGREKVNSFWSSIPTYYPNVGYDNNLEYFNVYFGDAEMHCNARHAASLFTKYVSKVYLFTFNYFIDYPLFNETCYGASHAVELPFFFPSVMKVRLTSKFYSLTPDEANFSKQLIRYWSNFIVSSNVNNNVSGSNLSADMVTWPSYTVCNNKRIMLKKNALSITSSLYSTVCPFWNGITDFPVQTC